MKYIDKVLAASKQKLDKARKQAFLEDLSEVQLRKICTAYDTYPSSGTKKK